MAFLLLLQRGEEMSPVTKKQQAITTANHNTPNEGLPGTARSSQGSGWFKICDNCCSFPAPCSYTEPPHNPPHSQPQTAAAPCRRGYRRRSSGWQSRPRPASLRGPATRTARPSCRCRCRVRPTRRTSRACSGWRSACHSGRSAAAASGSAAVVLAQQGPSLQVPV